MNRAPFQRMEKLIACSIGSRDETPQMLELWKEKLEAAGIRHTIVTHGTGFDGSLGRMTNLAKFRNEALAPLTAEYEKILFLNDVVYDLSDAITLLNTKGGKYDAACAMDFFGQFYDVFATREITGKPVGSGNYPYFEDPGSRKLLRAGDPVPVFSCWNGMVALNSAPFLQVRTYAHHIEGGLLRILCRATSRSGRWYPTMTLHLSRHPSAVSSLSISASYIIPVYLSTPVSRWDTTLSTIGMRATFCLSGILSC